MNTYNVVKQLNIPGFTLDNNTIVEMNTVIYNKDDNEDDWIKIIPDANIDDIYVILYVHECVDIKCIVFNSPITPKTEEWKNAFENCVNNMMPKVMRDN